MGLFPASAMYPAMLPVVPMNSWGLWSGHHIAYRFIPFGLCSNPSSYNLITGRVHYDENRNCVKDSADYGMQGQQVSVNGGSTYTFTDALGNYALAVGTGSFSVEHVPQYAHNNICPISPYTTNFSNTGNSVTNYDFADTSRNCVDLQIDLGTGWQRYCNTNNITVFYQNAGTITSTTTTITVTLPPNTIYVGSNPIPSGQNGNVLTYTISSLIPGQNGTIHIQDSVICDTALIGTILNFTADITSLDDDCDNYPNNASHPATVMAAWDPNNCLVMSQLPIQNGYVMTENIDNNDVLHYLINFQNTGNDTAFNITIVDVLPAFLDGYTVIAGASSHDYQMVRNGNELQFVFSNILLPDSNVNEAASHGYVKFQVQQVPGNSLGTQIINEANIFFDMNPAVVTNQTVNTIPAALGITNPMLNQAIKVFPNPASQSAAIEIVSNAKVSEVQIMDFTGKIVGIYALQNGKAQIKRNGLASGMYFLKGKDLNGNNYTGKVIFE